jgi:hypothetical protein
MLIQLVSSFHLGLVLKLDLILTCFSIIVKLLLLTRFILKQLKFLVCPTQVRICLAGTDIKWSTTIM